MSDIFGSYLEKDRELQNALSKTRLILAAVARAPGGQQSARELREVVDLSESDFERSLQRLADEGLVTASPGQNGLIVVVTPKGQRLAGL
jgi:DNA-binding MarR family transcriptional regulator